MQHGPSEEMEGEKGGRIKGKRRGEGGGRIKGKGVDGRGAACKERGDGMSLWGPGKKGEGKG